MTYRGAALANGALIATAEHSVLGTRWIYDATAGPVGEAERLRLVQAGGFGGPTAGRYPEGRGARRTAGAGHRPDGGHGGDPAQPCAAARRPAPRPRNPNA